MSVPPRTRASLAVLEERSFAAREVALPVQKFIHTEGVSGFFLLGAAVIALIWANSPWQASYFQLWEAKVSLQWAGWQLSKSLHHWINDGLMSLFFFVVGMEIKHELVH